MGNLDYDSYKHNSKEHFLKPLAGAPDHAELTARSRVEIAKIFAERTTQATIQESIRDPLHVLLAAHEGELAFKTPGAVKLRMTPRRRRRDLRSH